MISFELRRADTLSKKMTVPPSHLASSEPGMALESSGGRACDMCSKEKARWYCAADKAYLCVHCDASVHSANAVAHRHDRTRMCPNRSLDRNKKKNKRAKIMNCKKRTKATQTHRVKRAKPHELIPLHAWARSPKRRRSGRKPSIRTFISSNKLIMQEGYKHEKHITLEEEDEEEEGDGVLLHPPTPAPLCRNIAMKCEPSSPGVTYNLCSQITDDENPCLKAELELSDELVGLEVPTYEPFLEEINAASNGDFIKEILPCDSLSLSVPYFMSPSCFGAQNPWRSGSMMSLASLWTSSLISRTEANNLREPGHAEDIELSSVIEDGGISLKEDCSSVNGDDSDMEGLDVMKLCKIESSALTSCMEEQEPLMMEMQVDCSGIFGGNPFIKSKGTKELKNMVPCSSYPEQDVLRSDDFGGHFVVPDEQQLEAEYTSSFSTVGFQKSLILQLDYEDVLNAWSDRGSLWMDGQRPQVVPQLCFSHPGNIHTGIPTRYTDGDQCGKVPTMDEVEIVAREARVMRYKEKRRTRLFAKKIRYEVRKLNAERRPRLKGRFVKKISSQAEALIKEDKHH